MLKHKKRSWFKRLWIYETLFDRDMYSMWAIRRKFRIFIKILLIVFLWVAYYFGSLSMITFVCFHFLLVGFAVLMGLRRRQFARLALWRRRSRWFSKYYKVLVCRALLCEDEKDYLAQRVRVPVFCGRCDMEVKRYTWVEVVDREANEYILEVVVDGEDGEYFLVELVNPDTEDEYLFIEVPDSENKVGFTGRDEYLPLI